MYGGRSCSRKDNPPIVALFTSQMGSSSGQLRKINETQPQGGPQFEKHQNTKPRIFMAA